MYGQFKKAVLFKLSHKDYCRSCTCELRYYTSMAMMKTKVTSAVETVISVYVIVCYDITLHYTITWA